MQKTEVSIVRVNKIDDLKAVKDAARDSIDLAGGLEYAFRRTDRVLIKPNVLMPMDYRSGGITNPTVVEEVITSLISDAVKSGRTGRLKNVSFLIGQMLKPQDLKNIGDRTVFFGRCTRKYWKDKGIYINGCPPHILNVKKALGYTTEDFGDFSFMRTHLEKFGFEDE